eukprot:TRINITY_DN2847_c0_g1_i4.p3 TRINITY_DN2847_c0_g1~~TRINITY_DN2847_c0_g1_i4.p3  ORF type:complete len:129 (-),score=2.40 TRINITY_DN2847_c0_g1_i4:36-422(-)
MFEGFDWRIPIQDTYHECINSNTGGSSIDVYVQECLESNCDSSSIVIWVLFDSIQGKASNGYFMDVSGQVFIGLIKTYCMICTKICRLKEQKQQPSMVQSQEFLGIDQRCFCNIVHFSKAFQLILLQL